MKVFFKLKILHLRRIGYRERTFLLHNSSFVKPYKYKYNGKELQNELGLTVYDFDSFIKIKPLIIYGYQGFFVS